MLRGEIHDDTANVVIAQLLFLQDEHAAAPIHLHIDSPGGRLASCLAIRDAIDDIAPPVHTRALASVAGAAVLVLAHGARGKRTAAPTARVQFTPLAPGGDREYKLVAELLAADTGQSATDLEKSSREARRFDAEQARCYGLVDRIEP
jgi:ATP-dependent Clp protease protease subunit